MPQTPFLINGTVKNADNSAVSSVTVVAHDTTTGERISTSTDSEGKYILDLANLESGYTLGHPMTSYVRSNGYTGETSFTLSGEGSLEKNISVCNQVTFATLRNNLWLAVNNTLESGTFAISTGNIHSAMNDAQIDSEGYPQVIVHKPTFDRDGLDLSNTSIDCGTTFFVQIFHTTSASAGTLADEVENKFWIAQEVWDGLGLRGLETVSVDNDFYTTGGKKVHVVSFNAKFIFTEVISVA